MNHPDGVIYSKQWGKFRVECVQGCKRTDLTAFVARIYYDSFDFDLTYAELYEYLLKEDDLYQSISIIHTVYDAEDNILGTSRLMRANDEILLPIQKEFNVDLADIIKGNAPVNDVWELARTAVLQNQITIWRILLKETMRSFHQDDLVVAGQDNEIFHKLKKIGFPIKVIGEPKHYLGSLTYPVALSLRDVPRHVLL